ncbi:MAG: type I-E CRISPR-associated endonuclease Cas1e [Rhodospirillaceae bacterium]
MLKGRLGLDGARILHSDRHGLLWLTMGALSVEDGTLIFHASPGFEWGVGIYDIPYQTVSLILLGPGTSVTQDALRLMARHGTGLVAVGMDGVRAYSAPPLGSNDSTIARRQARVWADEDGSRLMVARTLYAWRLGEILPHTDISILRGIEGSRMKQTYRTLAEKFGVEWSGRRYDRANPGAADLPNQAINHAASAVEAAAMIAVSAVSAIPQLGFIHEDSANAFTLDIADLFRETVTIPSAFQAVTNYKKNSDVMLERHVRKQVGRVLRDASVIVSMIDKIKELFDADGRHRRA